MDLSENKLSKVSRFFLKEDGRHSEKGDLLVKFLVIGIIFSGAYGLSTEFTGFDIGKPMAYGVSAGFFLILLLLRVRLSISVAVQLFLFLCWLSIFLVSFFSGGIESYALGWIYGLPVVSFLLAKQQSAIVWSILGLLTIVFFFLSAEQTQVFSIDDFRSGPELILSLHVGVLSFMLTITYIFDRQKNKMVATISDLLRESNESHTIINERNTELLKANELINSQRNEILEKNEDLEKEVEYRTRKIVKINKQLREFAFMSSHNLRSPVAKILGLGDVISGDLDEPRKRELLNVLIKTTKDLDGVVRDLGKILEVKTDSKLQWEQLCLDKQIENVKRRISHHIDEKKAIVTTNFGENTKIYAVREYFESILLNLLENGIKYSHPNRRPEIEISIREEKEETVVIVSDNGIGIDLNKYGSEIFKLSSRFHDHVQGNGIGLYLTKSHVESMGGRLDIDSTIGHGTVFSISFNKPRQDKLKTELLQAPA